MTARTTFYYPAGTPGSIQRDGYINFGLLLSDITRDFLQLGFTPLATNKEVFPVVDLQISSSHNNESGVGLPDNDYLWVMFESNSFVDPLSPQLKDVGYAPHLDQKYRVCFKSTKLDERYRGDASNPEGYTHTPEGYYYWTLLHNLGFRIQVTADKVMGFDVLASGDPVLIDTRTLWGTYNYNSTHHLGDVSFNTWVHMRNYAFFRLDNWITIPPYSTLLLYITGYLDILLNIPLSYRLTVSDHGFSLFVWGEHPNSFMQIPHSWVVVQRPVNPLTGYPLRFGKCPLFCVFAMNPLNFYNDSSYNTNTNVTASRKQIYQFVVREIDMLAPGRYLPADDNWEDCSAILNSQCQVSITENNEYVVNFPNKLTTDRYYYMEELDLFCYTSADVISQYSTVSLSLYGENLQYGELEGVRSYMAMHSNGPYNTGMRVLFLVGGAGVNYVRNFY